MDGAGNDFVCINNIKENIAEQNFPALARRLCDRNTSVGADGMMVVEKAQSGEADFAMLFYNRDGSMGEMCGNGARCICRFGFENFLSGSSQKVMTTAGLLTGERLDQNLYRVRLQSPENLRMNEKALLDGKEYSYSYVELGNPGIPHAVVPIENLMSADRKEMFNLGRKFRFYEAFEKGANVNFYEKISDSEIVLLTYERGVEDFTKACGTGSASTVYIMMLSGETSGKGVKVNSMGGQLIIDICSGDEGRDKIYLSGPADIVEKGNIEI